MERLKSESVHDNQDIHAIERTVVLFRLPEAPPAFHQTQQSNGTGTEAPDQQPSIAMEVDGTAGTAGQDLGQHPSVKGTGLSTESLSDPVQVDEPIHGAPELSTQGAELATESPESLPAGDTPKDPLAVLFEQARDNLRQYTRSTLAVYSFLREFYGSTQLKKWNFEKQQGCRAEVGRAIQGVIAATKNPIHPNHPVPKTRKRNGLIVLGDAQFGTIPGANDKSDKFRYRLAHEALGQGVPVFRVDEFKTSATCCRCGSETQAKGRSLTCQSLGCKGIMIDRDHNAANNMATAGIQWLKTLTWPQHLSRAPVGDANQVSA
ncbi:hypothetical protein BGZ65_000790 [Modicella reniformis]|uniref:Cas12f1-like TNB domain-containing protein n=1 Tax=Modicella reniformis TaxID=1440133 RepID=A0A9P6MA77_9FUNG|nr:hypothetical protein BGZ65_000790 [Modicella reniformis]